MPVRTTARALALTTALLLAPGAATAATPAPATPATALPAATATALPASTTGPGEDAEVDDAQLLLLLDASRSMEDPDADGEPKIEAARSALAAVIDDLDPQQAVGLRVFGGDVDLDRPLSELCTDSRLVVPIGAGNADDLRDAVEGYAPRGETPIAYALQQAADDLGDEGQRTILLVSDGVATCDPDPCEVAEELSTDGLDLVVHTVGLGADAATRSQLQCIAGATGGQYADAADTDTLTSALTRISTRAFRPFTIEGTPVEGTLDVAGAPVIRAGQYTDTMAEDQDDPKHYLVRRELPGSILHVGVTMRPADGGGMSAYNMRLETSEGRVCGMGLGTPWSAGGQSSFGTGATSSAELGGWDPDDECTAADQLVLTVFPQNGSEPIVGEPFEMVVLEEPPVTNADELPERSPLPEWEGLEPGEPVEEVVAGSSLNDAPLLEPGATYSSELTRGEIVFFRVPVEHGQRLEALLEVAEPTGLLAETTGSVSDIADIDLIGPTRAGAVAVLADTGDLGTRAFLEPDRASRAVATTYEVRWANHGGNHNHKGSSLAGDYFVAVSLTSNNEMLLPVPFTLTTAVLGEVSGVPEYADAPAGADVTDEAVATSSPASDAATESEAPSAEPTGGAATAPELDEDSTSRALALLLGALGVVVLLAGVLVIAIRRRPSE